MKERDEALEIALINEEYKIWKKNSPFLYDMMATHALEWPSMTVQWLPDKELSSSKDFTTHRLLTGTNAPDDQNFLTVSEFRLPTDDSEVDMRVYQDSEGGMGGEGLIGVGGFPLGRVELAQQIPHPGPVRRARAMPHNPNLVCTNTTASGEVYIYDRSKHPNKPSRLPQTTSSSSTSSSSSSSSSSSTSSSASVPDITCHGQNGEGKALSWNPLISGQLLSSSTDKSVCLWEIGEGGGRTLNPISKFSGHTDVVNDVCWSPHHNHVFASASSDHTLVLWDSRKEGRVNKSNMRLGTHSSEVLSVAFSPFSQNVLIATYQDSSVALWDMRNPKTRLHSLQAHVGAVTSAMWCGAKETIVATASQDRRVCVWDLSRIGDPIEGLDTDDGPPELLFVHGGHTDRVSDLCWSPTEEFLMASVAEDNILQVWRMGDHIYKELRT